MTSVNCRACNWTMLQFCCMCNSIELVINFLVRHHVILGCCWCERCGRVCRLDFRCFSFRCDRRDSQVRPLSLLAFFGYYIFESKVTEIGRISVVMYLTDQFVYAKLQLTENGISIVSRLRHFTFHSQQRRVDVESVRARRLRALGCRVSIWG